MSEWRLRSFIASNIQAVQVALWVHVYICKIPLQESCCYTVCMSLLRVCLHPCCILLVGWDDTRFETYQFGMHIHLHLQFLDHHDYVNWEGTCVWAFWLVISKLLLLLSCLLWLFLLHFFFYFFGGCITVICLHLPLFSCYYLLLYQSFCSSLLPRLVLFGPKPSVCIWKNPACDNWRNRLMHGEPVMQIITEESQKFVTKPHYIALLEFSCVITAVDKKPSVQQSLVQVVIFSGTDCNWFTWQVYEKIQIQRDRKG